MSGWIMVTLILIYLGIVGFFVASRIDRWQKNQGSLEKEEYPQVLVFCEKEEPELKSWLKQEKLQAELVHGLLFKKDWNDVAMLVAISSNDSDNLSFCRIGMELYHPKVVMSVCNDGENQRIFLRSGIRIAATRHELFQKEWRR